MVAQQLPTMTQDQQDHTTEETTETRISDVISTLEELDFTPQEYAGLAALICVMLASDYDALAQGDEDSDEVNVDELRFYASEATKYGIIASLILPENDQDLDDELDDDNDDEMIEQ